MRIVLRLRKLWLGSALLRVGSVLGLITALAAVLVLVATQIAEQSAGMGRAINVSGSLRMRTWAIATQLVAGDADHVAITGSIADFEVRLADSSIERAVAAGSAPLAAAYHNVQARWHDEMRPLAQRVVDDPGDQVARTGFAGRASGYVDDIHLLVRLLEEDLEDKIRGLRRALDATLAAIVVLALAAMFGLRHEVFRPLAALGRAAREVQRGEFGSRVAVDREDELGQVGRAFNGMACDLGTLCREMEQRIAAKTADLERSNRSLALLYATSRDLARQPLSRATLAQVAVRLRDLLHLRSVSIASNLQGEDDPPADAEALAFPLIDGARRYGTLVLSLPPGVPLTDWDREVVDAVGRQVAVALAVADSREEHRRVALLEERAAIARELHDSIAQSLAFSKMQLGRLSAMLDPGRPEGREAVASGAAAGVVDDVREGVSEAYRELRELLSSFRLRVGERGLVDALAQAVSDFARRTGIDARLDDDGVQGCPLGANAQIHVLQLVREALSNVERHAAARSVRVALLRLPGSGPDPAAAEAAARFALPARPPSIGSCDRVRVTIEDDGVGLDADPPGPDDDAPHFGLDNMRARAGLLGGEVVFESRPGGGTRVRLEFPAIGPLDDGASRPAGAGRAPARAPVRVSIGEPST